MSRIFDALQRSEAEGSGVDSTSLSESTEMLLRAERRASSKWETAVLPEQTRAAKAEDRDASFAFNGRAPSSDEACSFHSSRVFAD